jgi:hypothetical protein
MDRRKLLVGAGAAAGLVVVGLASRKGRAFQAERAPFTDLYNGKDLSGWHAKDGAITAWKANGDMISCVGEGGGWLTSDKEYGDFVLRLEYRIPAGGNSGVGIRYPAQGDPAHVGMEIQVLDDDAPEYKGKLEAAQFNGGIYYQAAPTAHPAKAPGEWNQYVIRCEGPKIRVRLNRVTVQDINVEEFKEGKGGHKALAERPRKGHIGMQSHGHQVDFRNIRIREL